ncbi:MFS transporter [Clavibacter michiganensis]|uniref:Putative niacin/nicotinamide transporter NaiP n=1 Tax=Clavibacter michiganensis TaxID=28447 RepID=A0A251YJQ0_9MICO|nr:MFS transporter [Clavibacter michiganensis]OUE24383.1 putative niacin/nicotinamide transporter NaiP [Clavibacter michiganensis]
MSIIGRLDRLPLSRPHYALLLIGGLGYTFDGMDGAIIAFVLPSIAGVWDLSPAQLGLVGSATPLGFFFGAILSGWLGDRFGRKRVMLWALAFYTVMSIVAALAPSYGVFLVARVLAGVGAGAESVIIAPFISEFIPPKRRGAFIGSLAGFFSFGFVFAALIGRFIVPIGDDGWRWAQVITAVPILLLLWWRRALPESPRYLLSQGRTAEAEQVVATLERKVTASTKRPLPPVADDAPEPETDRHAVTIPRALKAMWAKPLRRRTAVIWVVWFSITFSYYGFFSWIPTLLIGRGISVTTSFEYSIIIYLAQIPGYFSAAFLNDKIDRKHTIAIYLMGAAVSAYWLSQSNDPAMIVTAAAVLSFFLNGTYAGVYAYTPELFPTWMRAMGSGFASAVGRIGSILAPTIIGVFSATLGFGGVFGLTTAVLAAGVITVIVFGVKTSGLSLEHIQQTGGAGGTGERSDAVQGTR